MQEERDSTAAIDELKEFLDSHPDSERFWELGELLLIANRADETIKLCERGLGFHPELAAGHFTYGKALVHQGKLADGIRAFERTCSLQYKNAETFYQIGQFLADMDQNEAAYPYLEKGQELDPEHSGILALRQRLDQKLPPGNRELDLGEEALDNDFVPTAQARKLISRSDDFAMMPPTMEMGNPIIRAGLTADLIPEISQAMDSVMEEDTREPPTMMDPRYLNPDPWKYESGQSQPISNEPPTMFEDSGKKPQSMPPPPTEFTDAPVGAVAPFRTPSGRQSESVSYFKVFLVLVPFLAVGLVLGGYVALRHIRAEKVEELLNQARTLISQDSFRDYGDAQVILRNLLDMDESHSQGNALLALVLARLSDEYGPNLSLKEEALRIVKQRRMLGIPDENDVYLLWASFHSGEDRDLQESVLKLLDRSPENPELLALTAEIDVKREKLDSAVARLQKSLAIQPSNIRTNYFLGKLAWRAKKFDEAEVFWEKALKLNPNHVHSLLGLARMRFDRGQKLDLVKADLEKVIELPQVTNPERAEARYLLARLDFSSNERVRAVAGVKAAAELLPTDWKFRIRLANLCREYNELDEATINAKSVLEENPQNMEMLLLVAGCNLPRGRADQTLEQLNTLVGKEVPAAPFLILRGEASLENGQYKKALRDLGDISNSAAEKPRARVLTVLALIGLGDEKEAYKEVNDVLRRYPEYGLAHYSLGRYRLLKKMKKSAEASFREALEKDPRCYQAAVQLASLSWQDLKDDQTLEWIKKALLANPYSLDAWQMLGQLYLKRNDPNTALETFLRVTKERRESPQAFVGIAEALLRVNQIDKALDAINEAEKLGANDAHTFHVEGKIHLQRSKFFSAVKALSRADRLQEKDPEILADYGLALVGTHNFTRAEKTFKESLKRRNSILAHEGLAKVFLLRRKYSDAGSEFGKAAYLAKRNASNPKQIADLYLEAGRAWLQERSKSYRDRKAAGLFALAVDVSPKDIGLLFDIAAAWDKAEYFSQARSAYQTVLSLDPKHQKTLYQLGLLEYADRKDAKAKELLQQFLETGPSEKEAKYAKEILEKIK